MRTISAAVLDGITRRMEEAEGRLAEVRSVWVQIQATAADDDDDGAMYYRMCELLEVQP